PARADSVGDTRHSARRARRSDRGSRSWRFDAGERRRGAGVNRRPAVPSKLMVTRRGFLAGGVAAALSLAARQARAIGPGSKFKFGQLQLSAGGRSDLGPRPGALRRLAWEIQKRTSVDVQLDPLLVSPTSETLHETPFLYLAGEREIDLPSSAGIEALRRF